MALHTTASQTVGPFFAIGLQPLYAGGPAGAQVPGERIAVWGRVLDGAGMPVPDAVLEFWQADAEGRFAHPEDTRDGPRPPGFNGFARVPTGDDGAFRLDTIKPGAVPGPTGALQAPHLLVLIFMRGLLKHLVTRLYFPDESLNDQDPILRLVPADRRATLIARQDAANGGELHWDVILQGDGETVFFDY